MEAFFKFILGVALIAGTLFALGLLMAFPIMWMWNYVMPDVFGLPLINVWQAFWGSFLIRLIFSGISTTTSK